MYNLLNNMTKWFLNLAAMKIIRESDQATQAQKFMLEHMGPSRSQRRRISMINFKANTKVIGDKLATKASRSQLGLTQGRTSNT